MTHLCRCHTVELIGQWLIDDQLPAVSCALFSRQFFVSSSIERQRKDKVYTAIVCPIYILLQTLYICTDYFYLVLSKVFDIATLCKLTQYKN